MPQRKTIPLSAMPDISDLGAAPAPGVVLSEKFLRPNGISQARLARAIGRPESGVCELVGGKRNLSVEMAWLLSRALSTDPLYWLALEDAYQLKRIDVESMPKVTVLVGPDGNVQFAKRLPR